nr:OB-fold nucleic acid binding domain-containing protein [bacterium]
PAYSRYEKRDQLQWEKELLGLYLSEHPLQDYRLFLSEKTNPINMLKAGMHEQKAVVGGNITSIRVITTKSGKQMAFVRLSDETNDIEVVVFPKIYEQAPSLWQVDNILVVEGKVDALARDGSLSEEFKVIASKVRELTHAHALAYKSTGKIKAQPKPKAVPMIKKDQRLFIRVIDANQHQQLEQLKTVLDANTGSYEVVLVTGENKKIIKIPYKLDISETALREVAEIFGAQNVKLH